MTFTIHHLENRTVYTTQYNAKPSNLMNNILIFIFIISIITIFLLMKYKGNSKKRIINKKIKRFTYNEQSKSTPIEKIKLFNELQK